MACLILDRFPIEIKNVEGDELKSQEIFDLSVIPNIVVLLRYVVETMQNHYPEIFERITVTPASWFFQTCFRLTSNVFEARVKERFHLIPTAQAEAYLESIFPKGASRGRQIESS